MNCPVCNRNNAVTLSICPSCGAMINDSVREELKSKILPLPKRVNFETKGNPPVSNKLNQQLVNPPKQTELKSPTAEIAAKPTAPTLVEFHTKTAALPEWRLQLQNAVRQRQETAETKNDPAVRQTKLVTHGANALKAEFIAEAEPVQHKNSTLNSALQRIEESRQKFLVEEKPPMVATNPATTTGKNHPFHIAFKQTEVAARTASKNAPISVPTKPKLASSLRLESEPLDTNKLPSLPKGEATPADFAENSTNLIEVEGKSLNILKAEDKIEIRLPKTEEIAEAEEENQEEFDDFAPFAMRFNAGLFDLIIGSFLSFILLAPFVLFGGNWLTFGGFFAFLTTCAIVMFIYLTTAIGLFGRTFGMRLFSLELIDIENEDYPSLHQAAVSSSIYLLSLALGGIGFLTLPFNEDRRAVHDIVSGTVVVREL